MIKENSVVTMTYVLRNAQRLILDASVGQPFLFLVGHKNVIAGLEKNVIGLKPGDRKSIEVPPEEGYGQYDPSLRISIPTQQFGTHNPEPGQQVQMKSPDGQPFLATVIELQGGNTLLDANHPLAGETLYFDLEILDVRDATTEEIRHGHPHHPGMPAH